MGSLVNFFNVIDDDMESYYCYISLASRVPMMINCIRKVLRSTSTRYVLHRSYLTLKFSVRNMTTIFGIFINNIL